MGAFANLGPRRHLASASREISVRYGDGVVYST
jgi:hypothetical protein